MKKIIRPLLLSATVLTAASLVLTGCAGGSSGGSGGASSPGDDGAITIAASTDVYGSIASAIGGDDVTVTSIIEGTSQDPHEFEATAQDKLAVANADLIVLNGAGYDDFMSTLVGDVDIPEVSAEKVTGLTEEGMGAEHFWYSLEGMKKVAAAIADELTTLDPSAKDTFAANLDEFDGKLDALLATVEGTKDCGDILMTEPVPGYLLEAAGCTDVTPPSFAEAIEEGTGVSVADLKSVTDLITGGSLHFLALNTQTEGPEAEQIIATADTANVPIVKFSETLPEGQDYVSWMTENVANIQAALK
ncbi:MAG: zinc ABC transporter substrate-binding protein [Microbacterium sp.]|uniref:metal ABC transporter solute-binding protein, Zn/Mn family n=1 Tax=Microbacterium sp. TaxID=51671 RepID=UPI001AC41D75|nr:zinc ABC transporter substrate-binding protein [Microbacterium sp.]MBN9177474.1 zinc ABC transporter substrate-binding protein [Microbacterium sp.]